MTKYISLDNLKKYNTKLNEVVDQKFTDHKYTAGDNITISDTNVISADVTEAVSKMYVLPYGTTYGTLGSEAYKILVSCVNHYLVAGTLPRVFYNAEGICTPEISNVVVSPYETYVQFHFYSGMYRYYQGQSSFGIDTYTLYNGANFSIYVKREEYDSGYVSNVYDTTSWTQNTIVVDKGTALGTIQGSQSSTALATGNNTAWTPQNDYNPATKKYVDDTVKNNTIVIQYTTLPEASETLLNKIVQYTGESGTGIQNGYFYKCMLVDEAYSWVQLDVQPSGGGTDRGIPTGGTTGQVLSKATDDDYNVAWTTPVDSDSFLAKDNTTEFVPTGNYNPATKLYVDGKGTTYLWDGKTSTELQKFMTDLKNGANASLVLRYNETLGSTVVSGYPLYVPLTVNTKGVSGNLATAYGIVSSTSTSIVLIQISFYCDSNWNVGTINTPTVLNIDLATYLTYIKLYSALEIPTYATYKAYSVGDFCVYNGTLYKCKIAVPDTQSSWNSANWTTGKLLDYIISKIPTYDGEVE